VQTSQGSTNGKTAETSLSNGGIDNPLRAEAVQETSRHLVTAGKIFRSAIRAFDQRIAFFHLRGE
jgi:hypothetical protein